MCARYSQNIFIPWQDKETSAEKPVEPKLFFFGEGGGESWVFFTTAPPLQASNAPPVGGAACKGAELLGEEWGEQLIENIFLALLLKKIYIFKF